MKRMILLILLFFLILPGKAFNAEDVEYIEITSLDFSRHYFSANFTYFNFELKGNIVNTASENVSITTPNTNLYQATIISDLAIETRGGYYPTAILPAVTTHEITPGSEEFSFGIEYGIFGEFVSLPDGNYTANVSISQIWSIERKFDYAIYIIEIVDGQVLSENTSSFTSPTNDEELTRTDILTAPGIFSFYLIFVLLPIIKKIRSK